MKYTWFLFCLIVVFFELFVPCSSVSAIQSLADAARTEAERRKTIEALGMEETVIEGNGSCHAGTGNVSVSNAPATNTEKLSMTVSSSNDRSSLRRYRSQLKKLDQNIRKEEDRLKKLQNRLLELKRDNLRIRDISKIVSNEESQESTEDKIRELQNNLKLLKKERSEVYDSGKRDGFLPGELEGNGIIP